MAGRPSEAVNRITKIGLSFNCKSVSRNWVFLICLGPLRFALHNSIKLNHRLQWRVWRIFVLRRD